MVGSAEPRWQVRATAVSLLHAGAFRFALQGANHVADSLRVHLFRIAGTPVPHVG